MTKCSMIRNADGTITVIKQLDMIARLSEWQREQRSSLSSLDTSVSRAVALGDILRSTDEASRSGMESTAFSRMAAAIRAGDDDAAEREFNALVKAIQGPAITEVALCQAVKQRMDVERARPDGPAMAQLRRRFQCASQ